MDQLITLPIQQSTCIYDWKGTAAEARDQGWFAQTPLSIDITYIRSCAHYDACYHVRPNARSYHLSLIPTILTPCTLNHLTFTLPRTIGPFVDRVEVYYQDKLLYGDQLLSPDDHQTISFVHYINPFNRELKYDVRYLRVSRNFHDEEEIIAVREIRPSKCLLPAQIIGQGVVTMPPMSHLSSEECVLCLEDVKYNSDLYLTSCRHLFHRSCIRSYLQHRNELRESSCTRCMVRDQWAESFTCPVCRSTLQ